MASRAIDLQGVPEAQARAIEAQVRYWQLEAAKQPIAAPRLPVWKGRVLGELTREELYEDR